MSAAILKVLVAVLMVSAALSIRYDWQQAAMACLSDDGTPYDCFWDAQEQGNGTGESFIAFMVFGKVCFIYPDQPSWNRCEDRP